MSDSQKDRSADVCVTHVHEASADKPEAVAEMMRSMHGPQAVDHSLRMAVSLCWMMLPDDKKNVDAVEREIRRLVDRALRDMREDFDSFFGKDEK
jgi:hypothetical protein